jgi:hypothetical protein
VSRIFGREPAVAIETLTAIALGVLLIIPMDTEVRGAADAAVLALAGLATAALVANERVLPALTGFIKAVFALIIAFGIDIADPTQTGILAVVSALATFFVRQQVTAPLPPAPPSGQHARAA